MFDAPTRDAIQRNELEFGSAIAGRGPDINAAIAALRPLLERLEPVMRNLASPSTGLGRFFKALEATAVGGRAGRRAAGAPVRLPRRHVHRPGRSVARPYIQETISKAPQTEDTTISTLPQIRPFLRHSEALFADFQPSARLLVSAAPAAGGGDPLRPAGAAQDAGPERGARRRPRRRWSTSATPRASLPGLQLLSQTNTTLDPTLAFFTPAQTVCNYVTLLLRNGSSIVSLGDGVGTWQRFLVLDPPTGPNNIGSPAGAPANGPDFANHLHYNPYPNTAAPGQPKECEAGNEPYNAGDDGDRQLARQPGHRDRGPAEEEEEEEERGGFLMARRRLSEGSKYNEAFFRSMGGPGPTAVGLFVVLLVVIGFYLAFAKKLPFTGVGYEVNATFHNAANIRDRLAGADRRRQRRQGDRRGAGRQRLPGQLHGQRGAAARSTPTPS